MQLQNCVFTNFECMVLSFHFMQIVLENNINFDTFERLAAFISLGFGRGAQVGKTSLLEVNLYGASVDVGRIFFIWYASGPGIPPKPSIFGRRRSIFLTIQSQDNEKITLQAAVRCCVTATLASETF